MKKANFFILLYLLSCATQGGVYQWTDENGNVHFGSIPPTQQNEYILGDKIKPAAKKEVEQPEENSPQSVEKSVQAEEPVQMEKPVEPEIPALQAEPIQKAKSTPVRKEELDALISKLRNDAGEVTEPKSDEAHSVQKNTESVSEPQQAKEAVVVAPTVISEPKPEATDADTPVVKQDLVKIEEASPLTVETPKVVPDHLTELREDESQAIPKILEETETPKPVTIEAPQVSPQQEMEAHVDEDQLDQKVLLEVTAEMPLSVEAAQAVSDKEIDMREDDGQLVQKDAPEAGRDSDKCGLFMGFVEQYTIKKREGCPGPHCDVYQRQLKKFKLKQKKYC